MSIRAPLRSRQVPISPLVHCNGDNARLSPKHQTHEATRWPWILPSHVQRHAAISNIPLSYRVSKKPTSLNTTSFAAPRTNLHKAANKELSLLCYQRIVSQFISCAIKSIVFGKITNSHKTRYKMVKPTWFGTFWIARQIKTIHNNTFRLTSSSTTLLFPTSIGEDLTAPGEEKTQRKRTYVTPLFLAYQKQKQRNIQKNFQMSRRTIFKDYPNNVEFFFN